MARKSRRANPAQSSAPTATTTVSAEPTVTTTNATRGRGLNLDVPIVWGHRLHRIVNTVNVSTVYNRHTGKWEFTSANGERMPYELTAADLFAKTGTDVLAGLANAIQSETV